MSATHLYMKLLSDLELAVTTGSIEAVVPEDLEAVAHNTLWDPDSPNELNLLKMLPSVPAKQVVHEFAKVTSYGNGRGTGLFSEESLPGTSRFATARKTVNIRLMGVIAPTMILANMEKMIEVLGTSSPAAAQEEAARRNLLRIKERNLYFLDTRTHRDGIESLRTKGLLQQIEEGTDGTDGVGYAGQSHVVDMEGEPLTLETIRERLGNAIKVFGAFNNLIMDSHTRGDFEGTLDAGTRLNYPIPWSPLVVGQHVAGVQSQGQQVMFHTSNGLDPAWTHPFYSGEGLEDGAPATVPSATVGTSSSTSAKFDAASAGNLYWVVTEIVGEKEGLGVRVPASGYTAVAAGQKATLTITPGNPLAHTFRIYRGDDSGSGTKEDAQMVFESANDGGGAPVDIDDLNNWRHGHATAFGLRIVSGSQRVLSSGKADAYDQAIANAASYFKQKDDPGRNTIAAVHLGPEMGQMELAYTLAYARRPLLFTACATECRNPLQNVVFKNIGRA